MKRKILFIVILFSLISSAQSENFKLNDCISMYELSFHDRSYAKAAHDSHKNPNNNEIHIIIGDKGTYSLEGLGGYSNIDSLQIALIEYQKNRVSKANYYFTIGLSSSTPFYKLEELFCGLNEISSEIKSDLIVKLYMF